MLMIASYQSGQLAITGSYSCGRQRKLRLTDIQRSAINRFFQARTRQNRHDIACVKAPYDLLTSVSWEDPCKRPLQRCL